MIDFEPAEVVEKKIEKNSLISGRKAFLILFLIFLIAILSWVLYLFIFNAGEYTLKEGDSQDYKGYTLIIDKVFENKCPTIPNFNCSTWQDEPGVQFHYKNNATGAATYAFLGMQTSPRLQQQGLLITLNEVNLNKKQVKITIKSAN